MYNYFKLAEENISQELRLKQEIILLKKQRKIKGLCNSKLYTEDFLILASVVTGDVFQFMLLLL